MASALRVLQGLYYAYPATVLAYFIISSGIAAATKSYVPGKGSAKKTTWSEKALITLLSLFLACHLIHLIWLFTKTAKLGLWPSEDHVVVGRLSIILVFGLQLSQLFDLRRPVWYPFYGSWILGAVFEAAIGTLTLIFAGRPQNNGILATDLALTAARFGLMVSMIAIGICRSRSRDEDDEEQQSLLKANATNTNGHENGYGSMNQANGTRQQANGTTGTPQKKGRETRWERRERIAREAMEKRLAAGGNWFQYAKEFKIFFPYIWPVGVRSLQIKAIGVIACLLTSNLLNLLMPRQTGIIMDSLGGSSDANPWVAVLVYIVLRVASSQAGVDLLRQILWTPVKYYSNEALTKAAFSHMMYLSADFHDSKSTSDMIMAIHGGQAIASVVESVLLHAFPMLIDLGVAVIYLSITFGSYEGLTTVATSVAFLLLAAKLVSRTSAISRGRITAHYAEYSIRTMGFLGWTTASTFNQLGYEDNRHSDAVATRWAAENKYMMTWNLSIAMQSIVLTAGLAVSAFFAVLRIRSGHATPGQFAMLLMYWSQLSGPLQFFARLGKNLSDDFVEAELLLEVMQMRPSVQSKQSARPLKFERGRVEFDNIHFSYDKQKTVINGISLQVEPGTTVALVGSTGAGKSTMLRLLDRFYDVTDGAIRIDGQDIRDVGLFSLRERIGVVPQNPILFDDSILSNVRYGNINASDEDAYDACKAACIHDKILEFGDGYETRVGEHGVKLSGGELQRVAIARAILKRPDIVLLDEATSAVDTDTEQQIQASFKKLCEGRTTFVVAHRLSTIMSADLIVVVEKGKIIEQGSHAELIEEEGRYADLWSKQAFLKPHKYAEDDDIIVNDMGNQEVAAEASKTKASEKKDVKESAVTGTPRHVKEDSRLNPVAPTFTPKSFSFATSPPKTRDPSSEASEAVNPESSNTSRQWSDEVAAAEEQKAAEAAKTQERIPKTGDLANSKGEQKRQAFQQAVDRALKRDDRNGAWRADVSKPET